MSPAERDALPVLHQFLSSHFNEKARWGLDWKRVAHRRVSHLPGPHRVAVQRLSGQSSTPVLVLDGEAVAGSAAILARLEARFPERPLLPEHPDERRRALEIQARFDREVGPAVRTAVFSVMIDEPGFLCRTFSREHGPAARTFYRASFPLLRSLVARAHETDRPERVARAFEIAAAAFDEVARAAGPSGQLVGERFSLADLGCAALLAPLVETGHPDMTRPVPVPDAVQALLARFAGHDGAAWVRAQYAQHRPPPARVA